jgi:hypothetical protein
VLQTPDSVLFQFVMTSSRMYYSWTNGGDLSISHRALIGSGSVGEVHEVEITFGLRLIVDVRYCERKGRRRIK